MNDPYPPIWWALRAGILGAWFSLQPTSPMEGFDFEWQVFWTTGAIVLLLVFYDYHKRADP